ncbi:MAG: Spy/CpxP family protein refolding chaperone [Acidobacteria bacterium]|nr:Spy/CpxP family protein refolding chaperone [Acidobacteriota bacterium]
MKLNGKIKKMMWMGIALTAVIAVAGFQLNAGTAFAQQRPGSHDGPPPGQRGPGGPGGPGGDRIFERLNLTDAQKQKIETLREQQHNESEPLHEQLQGLHEQMRAIVEAKTFDETAARALLAKEAQLETELKLIRIRTDNAVYNLLTAEQKAKLDELRRNQRGPGYGR